MVEFFLLLTYAILIYFQFCWYISSESVIFGLILDYSLFIVHDNSVVRDCMYVACLFSCSWICMNLLYTLILFLARSDIIVDTPPCEKGPQNSNRAFDCVWRYSGASIFSRISHQGCHSHPTFLILTVPHSPYYICLTCDDELQWSWFTQRGLAPSHPQDLSSYCIQPNLLEWLVSQGQVSRSCHTVGRDLWWGVVAVWWVHSTCDCRSAAPPFPITSHFPSPLLSSTSLSPFRRSKILLILLGIWMRAVGFPSGICAQSQPKSIWLHFSLQIWHLLVTVLMIFLRTKLTIFEICDIRMWLWECKRPLIQVPDGTWSSQTVPLSSSNAVSC